MGSHSSNSSGCNSFDAKMSYSKYLWWKDLQHKLHIFDALQRRFLNIFAGFRIDICALSWILENKTTETTKHKKDFDDQIPFKKYPKMSKMSFARNGCGVLHYLGVSGLNCLSLH